MKISVILPTLNEEKSIHSTLEDLFTRHAPEEVIVVDGGSGDKTVSLASEWTKVILSEKGRARQMNEGARRAAGDIFLFLHADTRLPPAGLEKIKEAVRKGAAGGRFRMRFDRRHWLLSLYESYTRFHFFSYGDQGFFVTRELFLVLGGFREEALFEDIDFYRRLRRLARPVILKDAVVTSARRFLQVGKVKQKLINLFLVALYTAGFKMSRAKEELYPEVR